MVDLLQDRGFKNVVHWGRGVNSEIFYQRPAPELYVGPRPYFLNVGRVSAEKNLDAFLSLDLPGTKIVVGDGPQRAHLEEKYPNAVFVGALSGEPLADWYNRSDVFVFPSLSDTFGLVNIEAIACGCPVAGFNVTGPKDIVKQNVTGIVHHDLEIAARGCLFLDKSKVVRDFSWEAATDQFFNNLCFR
jgi:glycosyltransferase involved in cell wall biosynthesis